MNIPTTEKFFDLEGTDYAYIYEDLNYPWSVIPRISDLVSDQLPGKVLGKLSEGASIGPDVSIGKDTVVEPGAHIKGPAVIGSNCTIRTGAYIRKNSVIGNDVTIGNSTEIKNSIVHDGAEIPHFSYVGDSVIGRRGHLGAGVKVSNLKVNRTSVVVHIGNHDVDTGMRKFGCLLGDHAEIGCNTVINPGTLIGKHTLAGSNLSLRGYYPPNKFVKLRQKQEIVRRRSSEDQI